MQARGRQPGALGEGNIAQRASTLRAVDAGAEPALLEALRRARCRAWPAPSAELARHAATTRCRRCRCCATSCPSSACVRHRLCLPSSRWAWSTTTPASPWPSAPWADWPALRVPWASRATEVIGRALPGRDGAGHRGFGRCRWACCLGKVHGRARPGRRCMAERPVRVSRWSCSRPPMCGRQLVRGGGWRLASALTAVLGTAHRPAWTWWQP